jgi:hypothetical protein
MSPLLRQVTERDAFYKTQFTLLMWTGSLSLVVKVVSESLESQTGAHHLETTTATD